MGFNLKYRIKARSVIRSIIITLESSIGIFMEFKIGWSNT